MSDTLLTEAEALARLRGLISYECNQSDLAKRFGVSRSFMSNVLTGKTRPPDEMLMQVGLRRVTFIEVCPPAPDETLPAPSRQKEDAHV